MTALGLPELPQNFQLSDDSQSDQLVGGLLCWAEEADDVEGVWQEARLGGVCGCR